MNLTWSKLFSEADFYKSVSKFYSRMLFNSRKARSLDREAKKRLSHIKYASKNSYWNNIDLNDSSDLLKRFYYKLSQNKSKKRITSSVCYNYYWKEMKIN